jgi:hypothetical protein
MITTFISTNYETLQTSGYLKMIIKSPQLNIFTKKSLNRLMTLSCCVLAFMLQLQASEVNKLTAEEMNSFHQCEKTFKYDVSFLGGSVGYLHRKIKWHKKTEAVEATVTSSGKVNFFWLDSTYHQTSTMHYSRQQEHFLTPAFSQILTGIQAREMSAEMSNNGLSSKVTLDSKITHYNNVNQPLHDIDTLGVQIRLNVLQGKTHFNLSRQASSKIENYQFEMVGTEVINHKRWGEITSIKVVEVGEYKDMALWFSAKHDHQMIMAELDMVFSPVVWLTHFSQNCH